MKKIGEILISTGLITQEELDQSLSEQRESKAQLGDILLSRGLVIEEDIYKGLAKQMGIEFFSNDQLLEATEDIVRLLPESFAKENTLIAAAQIDGTLKVAMSEPDDIVAIDEMQGLTNLEIEPVLATPVGIIQAIEQLYVRIRTRGEVDEVIGDLQFFAEADNEEEGLVDMTKADAKEADAPIVKLVNMIIAEALKERATDIHIEVQGERVSVRYRIDGVLEEVMTPPKSSHPGIISRIKIY